jgi:hypothetical protein
MGGPVSANQTYLVGEQGPELLSMGNFGGHVTPNNKIASGRNQTVHNHYHFNVHAHGADAAESIKKSRRQLERQAAATLSGTVRRAA